MDVLIIKLNATGDVVRTTPLLHRLDSRVTWVTAEKNLVLVEGVRKDLRCLSWEQRKRALDTDYDLVINLEDEAEVSMFVKEVSFQTLFGAYLNSQNQMSYTDDSSEWFDLSLISRFGRKEADKRKLRNRRSYQELIFEGLGLSFDRERYLLPEPIESGLAGDVAIAPKAGPVWPMKDWAHYNELKDELESAGFIVNVLPHRASLLHHLTDIGNHNCLIGGDSLPMHLALGIGTRCVTLFNCTSPWEIYDYGLLRKVVSPLLGEFFYKRGNDPRATTAIRIDEVLGASLEQLRAAATD